MSEVTYNARIINFDHHQQKADDQHKDGISSSSKTFPFILS